MASKPKSKAYVVLHRGRSGRGICMIFGRYIVGARNPNEAEELVKKKVGKHIKAKVYYEDPSLYMPHGSVVRD